VSLINYASAVTSSCLATFFQLSRSIDQIVFDNGCLSLIHSFSVTSAIDAINHVLLKTRFLGLYF